MKLSEEEKAALADHFKGMDLYDPSKAPEQETANFAPEIPGGETGYASGGEVEDGLSIDPTMGLQDPGGFAGPDLSADTATAHVPLSVPAAQPPLQASSLGSPSLLPAGQLPQAVAARALPRPSLLDAPEAPVGPESAAGGGGSPVRSLKRDEYGELMRFLQPSQGQRVGNAAFSGLAGLADAIMTGVAKAPSSNFQKNLTEKDSDERKDLINALKNKYEANFKGQELEQATKKLAEEARHNQAGEKETGRARELTQQAQDLTLKHQDEQLGFEKSKLEAEENKTALDQAQHTGSIWNKLKGTVGLGVPGPNPETLARAQGIAPPVKAAGPYGPTTVRNGKTYEWSPISKQYHPVAK